MSGTVFDAVRRIAELHEIEVAQRHKPISWWREQYGEDWVAASTKARSELDEAIREAAALAPEAWESRCHFCGGECRPFRVPDALWPADKLGQEQTCFNCFFDALGNPGEPLRVSPVSPDESELYQAIHAAAHGEPGESLCGPSDSRYCDGRCGGQPLESQKTRMQTYDELEEQIVRSFEHLASLDGSPVEDIVDAFVASYFKGLIDQAGQS